jgi:DNA-binding transcriptional ArsR family regulator
MRKINLARHAGFPHLHTVAQIPDAALDSVARRFRVLGEPARLRLLKILQGGECTVSELVRHSGMTQANVSRHLAVLVDAGILSRRRDGPFIHHAIQDPMIFQLCELVCAGLRRQLQFQVQNLSPSRPKSKH